MRLDYFCHLTVTDKKGRPLTSNTLKRLDGFIDKTEDSDFTMHMDSEMADSLIGEHVRFVFRDGILLARSSLHEKEPFSHESLAELTDYVTGQFLDGYGEGQIEVRKGLKLYQVNFTDEVEGPVKVDVKAPKEKPKKKIPDQALRHFHSAVMEGNFDAVRKYIEAGHDINAVPKQLETIVSVMPALGWAANRNQVEITKYLLANGADPNVRGKNAKGDTDGPALFYAEPEIAKLLLDAGAAPNAKNGEGLTRLEEISQTLEWHETHYDPEGMMAEFNLKEIQDLKEKLSALTSLFNSYN